MIDIIQLIGIVVALVGVGISIYQQGQQAGGQKKTNEGYNKRINTIEESELVTMPRLIMEQKLCRTEMFADIHKCQSELKNEMASVAMEVTTTRQDIADIKQDLKNNSVEITKNREESRENWHEVREALIGLTESIKQYRG